MIGKNIPLSTISKKYKTTVDNVQFLERLIDKHGFGILTNRKCYSNYEKEQIINRIINGESIISVAIDEGIKSKSMLSHWVQKYKENGYNIVERKRGRPIMKKITKNKEIRRRKFIFKSGIRILKKIESRCSSNEESITEEKVSVVSELRLKYNLKILLQISGLAKSVYYYTLSKIDKDIKNKEIFINNKERYGYRRITLELRNQGYNVNHKKVYRIMVKLGLKSLKRNKRKYSSYKGTIGKIADNPNEKWYTDVTEFNLRGEKIYLSPILDGFNGEIISYNTSKSSNLEQINDMLNKAFEKNNNLDGLIFHSKQGWQYQHQSYQQRLKNNGIKQSMSRKGNSMDNGMMENFFRLLKTEMFYNQEDKYKTIDDYIYYYNYDRIKEKLKGLSPVKYRLQSLNN